MAASVATPPTRLRLSTTPQNALPYRCFRRFLGGAATVAEGDAPPPSPQAGECVPARGVPPTAAAFARRFLPRLGVLASAADGDAGKETESPVAHTVCATLEEVRTGVSAAVGEGCDVSGVEVSAATGDTTAPVLAFLADFL